MKLKLYHYWRSSSSWRVRWALELKKLNCEYVHVGLLDGESEAEPHRKRNPMGYVPVLEVDGKFIAESIAIIEWLEEIAPTPALLSGDSWRRAEIRMLSEIINAGTQPLQNLSATLHHSSDPTEQKRWMQHWIKNGLEAYETIAKRHAGTFTFGDEITLADVCLIPQVYSAQRQEVDLSPYPTVKRINERALQTEACMLSSPDRYKPEEFKT